MSSVGVFMSEADSGRVQLKLVRGVVAGHSQDLEDVFYRERLCAEDQVRGET